MARKKSEHYSGALRTPINLDHVVGLKDEEVEKELIRKLPLLCDHYKIDRSLPIEEVWGLLALRLAFAHVPGFQIARPKRKGRKRKWALAEARALVAAVDAHNPARGIKVAIGSAIKQKGWRWGRTTSGIETRYHEARRQILQHEIAMKYPPFSAERLLAYSELPRIRRTRKMRPK